MCPFKWKVRTALSCPTIFTASLCMNTPAWGAARCCKINLCEGVLHFAASCPIRNHSETSVGSSATVMPPSHNLPQCGVGFIGSHSVTWRGSERLIVLCDFITNQPHLHCCQTSSLFSPRYVICKLEDSFFSSQYQLYLNVPWLRAWTSFLMHFDASRCLRGT